MVAIQKDTFLTHWLFWSAAVWVVSGVLMLPGAIILVVFLSFLTPNSFITNVIAAAYAGGVIGVVVSYAQHRLMQRFLFVTDKDWWRRSALVGVPAGVGTLMLTEGLTTMFRQMHCGSAYYCYPLIEDEFYLLLVSILPMTVFITLISLVQWRILRRYVDASWLWVLANAVGGILFGMLYHTKFSNVIPVQLVLAVLGQGAVTGAVMLWLFIHKAQPLVVPRRAVTSVWDEAI